ncbi:MAG: CBS domain-containing protein [Verrucomicrobiota bacterium]|nr:CBS domain-containing protein [Verrucomicrobiota bacterium]
MRTVRDILSTKTINQIYSISPDLPTYDALKLMAEKDVGAIAVVQNGKLLGLLTEREYARRIVLEGKASRHTPVGDTMNTRLVFVDPAQSLEECMTLMTEKKMRYLPVMENGNFIGLVSIGDVVKNVIIDYKYNVEQLERYISGAHA